MRSGGGECSSYNMKMSFFRVFTSLNLANAADKQQLLASLGAAILIGLASLLPTFPGNGAALAASYASRYDLLRFEGDSHDGQYYHLKEDGLFKTIQNGLSMG